MTIPTTDASTGTAATVDPTTLAPDTGRPLSRIEIVRYGIGFFAFSFLWIIGLMIVAAVLLPTRLTALVGADQATSIFGVVNSITAVISLISNLVAGNLSDRTRSRFGRRTPWVLSGAIIAGVTLITTGLAPNAILLSISYCVCMIGLNMMIAPAVATLSDRVPESVRGSMSAFYGGGAVAGQPIGTLIGSAFIAALNPGFLLGGILMFLGGFVAVAVWPREKSAVDLPAPQAGVKELLLSFRPPRKAPDFYRAFMSRVTMLTSYQMIAIYQLFIVQKYLGQSEAESAATIATMSVITLVVSLVAAFGSGPISDKIGRRKVPVVVASVLFCIGIAMPWIFPTTLGMFLYAGIAGFGYGVYSAVDQALNVDVLPNPQEAGKDLGFLNLATTLGQTIAPLLAAFIVATTNSFAAIFPVGIVIALFGAFFVLRIKSVK